MTLVALVALMVLVDLVLLLAVNFCQHLSTFILLLLVRGEGSLVWGPTCQGVLGLVCFHLKYGASLFAMGPLILILTQPPCENCIILGSHGTKKAMALTTQYVHNTSKVSEATHS